MNMNVRIELLNETLSFGDKRDFWNASYSTTIPSDIDFDKAQDLVNVIISQHFGEQKDSRMIFRLSSLSKNPVSNTYTFGLKNKKGFTYAAMEVFKNKPKEITLEIALE